ncbi:unnamed protein product [Phytophthora lilii]|uniref:Unnamed protein product n=1 Tax=Phytophthora lilii TaxID=2077276 RepID=A0A9W7D8S7_9STRA|nr:unnamed protein product [Phytophthora lilii]
MLLLSFTTTMLTATHAQSLNASKIAMDVVLEWALAKDKEEKRRQHRIDMVKFRRKQKEKNNNFQNEFRRLNKQVKLLVTPMKVAACSSTVEPTKSPPMKNTMRELLVEVEDLRMQNIAPQKEISLHHIYQKVVQAGPPGHEDDEPILTSLDGVNAFPMTNPLFTFTPSITTVFEAMNKEDRDSWPVIVTSLNWGSAALGGASTVVLQEFDENSSVLVRNVNGTVNLRYVCFAHRSRWTEEKGKRVISYAMVISDSTTPGPARAESI